MERNWSAWIALPIPTTPRLAAGRDGSRSLRVPPERISPGRQGSRPRCLDPPLHVRPSISPAPVDLEEAFFSRVFQSEARTLGRRRCEQGVGYNLPQPVAKCPGGKRTQVWASSSSVDTGLNGFAVAQPRPKIEQTVLLRYRTAEARIGPSASRRTEGNMGPVLYIARDIAIAHLEELHNVRFLINTSPKIRESAEGGFAINERVRRTRVRPLATASWASLKR